jgi:hypothetical protein
MNLMREQLTSDFHLNRCKSYINGLCASRPSSLFAELARYLSNCLPVERQLWALVVWEVLTSEGFARWKFGFEGLPSLILIIYDELS